MLDNRYTITAKLGDGGMGAVYLGTQHSVGRDVAIKMIAPSLVSDPLAIKRFLREANLASQLSHPNAVAVLDFGQTPDGLLYLVMELVRGRTLATLLDDEPALSPQRVVRIASQICDALEGAHALQIVHRDLKPANVMLISGGRDLVKVLDFGVAKSVNTNATAMTNTGAMIGTPAFMPPELAVGDECDARTDLYSLGCMLYAMLTGRLPFAASTVHEMIHKHASEDPEPMSEVPGALAAVVMRLLAKQRDDRFPSAAAARDALEAAIDAMRSSAPVVASLPSAATPPPETLSSIAGEPPPRKRRLVGIAALGVVVLAAAVVAFVALGRDDDRAPTSQAIPAAATPPPVREPTTIVAPPKPAAEPTAPTAPATVTTSPAHVVEKPRHVHHETAPKAGSATTAPTPTPAAPGSDDNTPF